MNTTSYTELQKVIKMGAIRVVVPGNFPIGCISAYAATFATEDPTMYDELGCLKRLNDIAKFYSDHLQQAIRELQKEHPHTVIIYGDYFHGLREVLRLAPVLGISYLSISLVKSLVWLCLESSKLVELIYHH